MNCQNGSSVSKTTPNYGPATYMLTRFMKQQTLMYQSTSRTDAYFLFRKKTQKRLRNGTISFYFECQTCLDANDPFDRLKPCRVTVNEGLILTNPDVGHSQFCAPLSKVQLERLRLDRETRQKCRMLGMAPSAAYQEMISQIPDRTNNVVEQALLATYLPSYKSVRTSLYRHMRRGQSSNDAQNKPPNLPNDGSLTMSSESLQSKTLLLSKLCNQRQQPSFSKNSEFFQFYTINGLQDSVGSPSPICFALLPKQNQPNSYIIFHKLKEVLSSFYGNSEHIRPTVTDFDSAAVQAIISVIQNGVSVVGCTLNLRYTSGELSTTPNLVEIVNVLALFAPHSLLRVWNKFRYDPIRLHLELPDEIKKIITAKIAESDNEKKIRHSSVADKKKSKLKRRKVSQIPSAYREQFSSLILDALIGD